MSAFDNLMRYLDPPGSRAAPEDLNADQNDRTLQRLWGPAANLRTDLKAQLPAGVKVQEVRTSSRIPQGYVPISSDAIAGQAGFPVAGAPAAPVVGEGAPLNAATAGLARINAGPRLAPRPTSESLLNAARLLGQGLGFGDLATPYTAPGALSGGVRG